MITLAKYKKREILFFPLLLFFRRDALKEQFGKELSNEYLLTKVGFDTAENEPLKFWRILGYWAPAGGYWDTGILAPPPGINNTEYPLIVHR